MLLKKCYVGNYFRVENFNKQNLPSAKVSQITGAYPGFSSIKKQFLAPLPPSPLLKGMLRNHKVTCMVRTQHKSQLNKSPLEKITQYFLRVGTKQIAWKFNQKRAYIKLITNMIKDQLDQISSYSTKRGTTFFQPPWQICSSDSCNNGCCQSTPCENGGTCSEVCDIRAKRFKCACPPGYTGDKCQEAQRSCHDILLSGIHANGIYQIRNEANETLNVYCDFDSEPGAAWTLIQSYSLENGQSGGIDNDIFSTKPLFEDFPVNGVFRDNWSSYRLSLDDMKLIRAYSTHWRATCEFPTIGIDFRDYFRVLLQDYDVIEEPPMYTTYCKRYEFMNVRGNQCLNCYARTGVFEDRAPYILSYYLPGQGLCNFYGRPYEGIVGEHNFGYYKTPNPAFRCSAGSNSTTQYWFGKM